MTIEEHFQRCKRAGVDMSGHLDTLRQYANGSHYVLELGVRGIVSTWALLAARPKIMVSVDKVHPRHHHANLHEVKQLAWRAGVRYRFILGDDLTIKLRGPFTMVFIDTWHVYDQLLAELNRYAPKTKRFILMHDTVTFGQHGEGGRRGLKPAIGDFLSGPNGKPWRLIREYSHSHGLSILGRS